MPTYSVGDEVEVKLKGWSKHYPGKIAAISADGKFYTVHFDDGDKSDKVKSYNMRPKATNVTFTAPDGKTFSSRSEYRKYVSALM